MRRPVSEGEMYAVRMAGPPKHRLVGSRSAHQAGSRTQLSGTLGADDGDARVKERLDGDGALGIERQRVEQLARGKASEQEEVVGGVPPNSSAIVSPLVAASCPGALSRRRTMRRASVSLRYRMAPSGDRPIPLGSATGNTASVAWSAPAGT